MFNPSHPFGTVHGSNGAVYYQDGKHYDAAHQEIDIDTGQLVVVSENELEEAEPAVELEADIQGFLDSPAEIASDTPDAVTKEEIDLDSLPYQTIKKMVISAGGVYIDKAQGIAYLRSM